MVYSVLIDLMISSSVLSAVRLFTHCFILIFSQSKTLFFMSNGLILFLIFYFSECLLWPYDVLLLSLPLCLIIRWRKWRILYGYSVLRDPSTSSFWRSKTLSLLSFSHPEFSDPSISFFWRSSSSFGTLSSLSFSRSKYSLNFLLSRFCNYH